MIVLAITYWEYARYVIVSIMILYAIRLFARMYRFVSRFLIGTTAKSVYAIYLLGD
jgi:hypothetical protein